MKQIVCIGLSLIVASSLYSNNAINSDTFEYKNDTLRVRISKDSVNRIVLPAPITGKILSAEKNLSVQLNDNEAYIKVIPSKKTEFVGNKAIKSDLSYTDREAEVFFTTEKKTYSIVFVPDKIDTRTVYITDNTLAKAAALKVEKNSTEYTSNIKNIFKLAISNELGNSFTEKIRNEKHDDFYLVSEFDGVNYVLFKFVLKDINKHSTLQKINKSIKTAVVAVATFENNYYILGAKDE